MTKAGRHAVSAKGIDDIGGAYLVAHRVEIQPEARGNLRDLGDGSLQSRFLVSRQAAPSL
ncbi:hypothetical protein D3C73_1484680 [compost metagenome]